MHIDVCISMMYVYLVYRQAVWRFMNARFRMGLTSVREKAEMEGERNTQKVSAL